MRDGCQMSEMSEKKREIVKIMRYLMRKKKRVRKISTNPKFILLKKKNIDHVIIEASSHGISQKRLRNITQCNK